ncbi:MFS transporter [Streptomyces anulatus]|uniref:MFS transporter n=1 Tax=Streptomyces anulatus TaxID=1892 RepID=UPI00365A2D0A
MTSLTPATAAAKRDPRLWGLLFVLAGNMLIDALEVSVLVVAAPSIGADLRLAPAVLQWTISGFALGFGGLLLFGARVVALLGRRRVYLAALLAFAAASLVAALATDPALLTATRFVKGFCAALTAPTGLAIISTAFREGPARDRAVSVYTLFGAAGFTAGLLLSGLLTSVSWRWTLAFPAPVVLLLFLFARRLLPPDEPTTDRSGSGKGSGGGSSSPGVCCRPPRRPRPGADRERVPGARRPARRTFRPPPPPRSGTTSPVRPLWPAVC